MSNSGSEESRSSPSEFLGKIRALFSLEAVILALMFPLAYGGNWSKLLPVSFRVLFMLVAVVLVGNLILNKGVRNLGEYYKIVALYLAFVTYLLISNIWSVGSIYATEKSQLLLSTDLLLFLVCSFIFFRKGAGNKICIAALVLTIVTLMHIYAVLSTNPLDLEELIAGYQLISLTLGCLASILLAAILFMQNHIVLQVAYISVTGAAIAAITMSGGRGGILVILVAMALFSVILLRPVKRHLLILDRRRVGFLILLAAMAGTLAWVLIAMDRIPISLARLVSPSSEIASSAERSMLMRSALELWIQHPMFGAGNGAFPVLAGLGDQPGYYPHNILLELLVEYGLVGFIWFCTLTIFSLRLYARTVTDIENIDQLLPLLLFLIVFSGSMVIGDISSNLLHCGLGMLISPSWRLYNEERGQPPLSLRGRHPRNFNNGLRV